MFYSVKSGLVILVTFSISFASSLGYEQLQAKSKPSQDANQLLIVDCMLPGKIRQLGGGTRYQSARRPIKTSGANCEIRGGEYVAYDRANYATALKVWLPQAKSGDAKAQTYVGEMFEKGLGTQPDYATALKWYMQAAEQGYDRAQMNIGGMYEKGLGVTKDELMALNWYRKATGLGEDELTFSSNLNEIEAEAEGLRKTLAQKNIEIEHLNKNLQTSRSKINLQITELDNSTRELEHLRFRAEYPKTSASGVAEISKLNRQIQEKETLLSTKQKQVQAMRIAMDRQQAELAYRLDNEQGAQKSFQSISTQQNEAIARLERQNAGLVSKLSQKQSDLQAKNSQMVSLRENLKVARNNTDETQKIASLTAIIQQQQVDLEESSHSISFLEKEISSQNQQIKTEKMEFSKHKQQWRDSADIALLQQQSVQDKLQISKNQLQSAQSELARSNTLISQQQTELDKQKNQIDLIRTSTDKKTQSRMSELESQLGNSAIGLARSQGENAALRVEISAINRELERFRTLQAELNDSAALAMRGAAPLPSIVTQNSVIPNINFGNYYALIIGNNNYPNLPDLKTPRSDAEAIAKILRKQYGFKTEVLLNADRYTILQALNKYRGKLSKDDNFLIYYAGHGELDRSNNRGHWLPVDAMPNDQTNWISNIQVTDFINSMSAKHIMVIADSCYSGTLTSNINIPQLASNSMATRNGNDSIQARKPDKYYKIFTAKKSRTAMTSGGTKPVLDGGGGTHSIFANHLINVLENNRGVLEGWMLYHRVNRGVQVSASSLNIDQEPEFAEIKNTGHAGAPFFFVGT
ncbi:MAG: caspase family protein [Xanthomonadales bacterium]|nr:caspase family protein [Xanthomonadales bacterium]